jgi:YbbR domain-containing protein
MAWHPFRNLGLKIVALGLAVLLWFTISSPQVERSVRVPLVYRNVPATLQMTGDPVDTVNVHIRGGGTQVSQIAAGEVVVVADLAGAAAGSTVLPLRTDQVKVPYGVEVTQIDPSAVTVTLEKSGSAEVPIKPAINGQPAPGYLVAMITSDPRRVVITGPVSRLNDTVVATTEPISIDGATAPLVQTVNVGVTDAELRLKQPVTARVTVQIVPSTGQLTARTFPERAITFRNAEGQKATAEPAAVTVTVRAPAAVLAGLDAKSIQPYVDLTDLGPGRHVLAVHVDLGGDYALGAITPSTVTVHIR